VLDIAFIRQNQDAVRAAIKNKRFDLDLDELLEADRVRKETITNLEARRKRKNEVAQAIPKATKEERPILIEEGKTIKADIEKL
jgi:seryl-tRNA synthetase